MENWPAQSSYYRRCLRASICDGLTFYRWFGTWKWNAITTAFVLPLCRLCFHTGTCLSDIFAFTFHLWWTMDFTPELNLNFDVDIFKTGYGSNTVETENRFSSYFCLSLRNIFWLNFSWLLHPPIWNICQFRGCFRCVSQIQSRHF